MTFTVYGLRLKGDCEIRYIGQTNGDPANRISNLRTCEVGVRNWTAFGKWLADNATEIEPVTIATFATRDEAKNGERVAILTAIHCGQRLFNRDHVPKHLRICSNRFAIEVAA